MALFTTEELHENANYIIRILQSNKSIFWCWGARGFVYLEYKGMKTLRMRVSGLKHKGYVYICLNEGKDLFEAYATNLKNEVKREMSDLYIEDLIDAIDEMVEKGTMSDAEYKKRLSKVKYKI